MIPEHRKLPCLSLFLFITGLCACATAIQTNRVQKRRIQKAAWLHCMSVEACRSWKQCRHPRILPKSLNFQRSEVLRLYGTCLLRSHIFGAESERICRGESWPISSCMKVIENPRVPSMGRGRIFAYIDPIKNQHIQSSHGWYGILWFIKNPLSFCRPQVLAALDQGIRSGWSLKTTSMGFWAGWNLPYVTVICYGYLHVNIMLIQGDASWFMLVHVVMHPVFLLTHVHRCWFTCFSSRILVYMIEGSLCHVYVAMPNADDVLVTYVDTCRCIK